MKVFGFIILLVVLSVTNANSAKFLAEKPPFLTPCDRNDANFNSCFGNNFQVLFREWKNGLPGLKSESTLDPLLIKRATIHQNSGPVLNGDLELQNVAITGTSQAIVNEASIDTHKKKFVLSVKITVPKLRLEGDYKAKGTVLALNINSQGKVSFEAENVVLSFLMNTKLRDEYGVTFADLDAVKMEINDISNFHVNVQNLFNGQRELEDSANEIFNENWRQLFEVLRPTLDETMRVVLEDRFRKVLGFVPANYFIKNMPTAEEFYA